MVTKQESVLDALLKRGMKRRDFLKLCVVMAGTLAMPKTAHAEIAQALSTPAKRTPVIWLEFQDCAGCSESFLRASRPSAAEVVLETLSVDYHETIMAASGHLAEETKAKTIEEGGYLLVVEGSIPVGDDGAYCCIGGRSAEDLLAEAASKAVAVIAVGSCAAFGGLPKAAPNPTNAKSVMELVTDKPVLNLPGCPVNVVNLTATVVHYLTFGTLPAMDTLHRPLFAYGALIHDNCERRGHFDRAEFVRAWGDAGHKNGWCLYQMGCKGPITSHNCPSVRWNEGVNWPIGGGHGCIGCSEPDFWEQPMYEPVKLNEVTSPVAYVPVGAARQSVTPQGVGLTAGTVGMVGGAALAFGYSVLTNRTRGSLPEASEDEHSEDEPSDEGSTHHGAS